MEFYDHRHAAASLAAMNGRKIMGKVSYRIYRVSGDGWATGVVVCLTVSEPLGFIVPCVERVFQLIRGEFAAARFKLRSSTS